MHIHRSHPEDFLLILPDESIADLVLNGGQSIRTPFFRLHTKRWSHQAHSTDRALPFMVGLELHSVPEHAWELATAKQLLNPFCWI